MKITQLTKRYKRVTALEDVSLELAPHAITAVLGESGAGKTTLRNAIAGQLSYEGSIEGAGRISYLFQSPALLPNLTAAQNLKFVLPKSEWGGVEEMLARVGLKGRENARPSELSGGEKQRVAIARAFLFPHDTLLMDEPFSSLDLGLKRSLIALVTQLWQERGSTVVFVTHDVHEAALLASRAVVLKGGKIACEVDIPAPYPRDFFSRSGEEEMLVHALMGDEGAQI